MQNPTPQPPYQALAWSYGYFACFSCARRSVRMMKPRIPKPTSGHLDRSYFFLVSRGRIRISTLRRPEVGLEFQL